MHIKDMIINYRTENRYSQRAFAAKCGLSNGYVSMLEKNLNPTTRKPPVYTYETLQKLAYGMDMDVNDLIKTADNLPIYTGKCLPVNLQAFAEDYEQSERLTVSKPSEDIKAAEVRAFLHNLIDELSDEDLFFMKEFSVRIARK